ncbi:GNAT family N-acetyltransferase [Pseudonocardia asaccharolytica]|uniref:GCN5 family N-acetyltransferase n=1 Tax=Pseudonocardia asaccharolytica DSM 44247 = NBRC 16224 TaxID=1123024 RepID=A0A511CXL9_9PSEU|nr:N-acetyltransferase [Pseudonocardia asaccharolytica]GEL17306.1 GCN5 family N-acetyltransferase [Pseudonocardia asaccharolytica DSM 44247 = NBRC 16224]
MAIRPECPDDAAAITRVTELAFRDHPHSEHTEQHIIEQLRRGDALSMSLVAEAAGQVVGHIAFSSVEFSDGSAGWYALGPVSVAPARQGQGIGRALIDAGLAGLRGRGAAGCVVVGEPALYGRFGFRSRPDVTMDGVPQRYVQLLAFGAGRPAGRVTHHPAFGARP